MSKKTDIPSFLFTKKNREKNMCYNVLVFEDKKKNKEKENDERKFEKRIRKDGNDIVFVHEKK